MVRVDVEYCGSCGGERKYKEMKEVVTKRVPETKMSGKEGRQGSFEVEIDCTKVYSKLQMVAYPDFEEVADVVEEVSMGGLPRPVTKQQDINCCIM